MHKEKIILNKASANPTAKFINQQLCHKETLASHLSKAEALAEIAMTNDFLDQDETVQRRFLWTIRDLLTDAEQLNEQQISDWMEHLKNFDDDLTSILEK